MSKVTRIQVPLKHETRKALQALADARGSSLASLCADLLEEMVPTVEILTEALQVAKKAPAAAMRQSLEAMDAKLAEIDQMKLELEPKPKRARKKKAS